MGDLNPEQTAALNAAIGKLKESGRLPKIAHNQDRVSTSEHLSVPESPGTRLEKADYIIGHKVGYGALEDKAGVEASGKNGDITVDLHTPYEAGPLSFKVVEAHIDDTGKLLNTPKVKSESASEHSTAVGRKY